MAAVACDRVRCSRFVGKGVAATVAKVGPLEMISRSLVEIREAAISTCPALPPLRRIGPR